MSIYSPANIDSVGYVMNTILLPVDLSSSTGLLYEKAISMAKAFASTVYLIHVVLPNEDTSSKDKKEMGREFADESQALNRLATGLRDEGIETHALLMEGVAAKVILEEAKRLDADLIILGSHGHGPLVGTLMGDVSQAVTRDTSCPVLIVPTRG